MFYLISTQILKDGTTAQTITPYADKDEAMSAFHMTMGSNYIGTTIQTCSCLVINEIGGVLKTEYIQRPQPEPNAE